jgi:hypothetical protein
MKARSLKGADMRPDGCTAAARIVRLAAKSAENPFFRLTVPQWKGYLSIHIAVKCSGAVSLGKCSGGESAKRRRCSGSAKFIYAGQAEQGVSKLKCSSQEYSG